MIIRRPEVHLIDLARYFSIYSYNCGGNLLPSSSPEEAYSSKVDHLAYETMEHHEKYLGKRVKRGLFKSSTGKFLNADVNGAIGIARKVTGDEFVKNLISRGQALCPIIFNINCLTKV